jgi:hypothetical protein
MVIPWKHQKGLLKQKGLRDSISVLFSGQSVEKFWKIFWFLFNRSSFVQTFYFCADKLDWKGKFGIFKKRGNSCISYLNETMKTNNPRYYREINIWLGAFCVWILYLIVNY